MSEHLISVFNWFIQSVLLLTHYATELIKVMYGGIGVQKHNNSDNATLCRSVKPVGKKDDLVSCLAKSIFQNYF